MNNVETDATMLNNTLYVSSQIRCVSLCDLQTNRLETNGTFTCLAQPFDIYMVKQKIYTCSLCICYLCNVTFCCCKQNNNNNKTLTLFNDSRFILCSNDSATKELMLHVRVTAFCLPATGLLLCDLTQDQYFHYY